MIPVGLIVSVSTAIEHHSVVCTFRESFHRVLRCREIARLHGSFRVNAAVGSVAVVLWLLAEDLARRLTLRVKVMPIDLRTLVFVRVFIMGVWIKVGLMLVFKMKKAIGCFVFLPALTAIIFFRTLFCSFSFTNIQLVNMNRQKVNNLLPIPSPSPSFCGPYTSYILVSLMVENIAHLLTTAKIMGLSLISI